LFTKAELDAVEMLRGIPNDVNAELHLSGIRTIWNEFYKNIDLGKVPLTRESFLQKAKEIDAIFGSLFNPPI